MIGLFDAFLPRRCLYCKDLVAERIFCEPCASMVKLADTHDSAPTALFVYGGLLRELILLAKFQPDEGIGRSLSRYLTQTSQELRPDIKIFESRYDCIAYVPSHWKRRLTRGYELPGLFANSLAATVNAPVKHVLSCSRFDPPISSSRNATERLHQVEGRYSLRDFKRRPSNILLVDDIITTGATISACAKILEEAGHHVQCFAFAKTIMSTPASKAQEVSPIG